MDDPRLAQLEKTHSEDLAAVMDQLLAQSAPPPAVVPAEQVTIFLPGGKPLLVWRADAKEWLRAGEAFLTAVEAFAAAPDAPAPPPPPAVEPEPEPEPVDPDADLKLAAAAAAEQEASAPPEPPAAEPPPVMSRKDMFVAYKDKFGKRAPGNASNKWLRSKLE